MSILSTVQAIQLGIESIEARTDIPSRKKEQAIKLLSSLEQSDWYQNWTKDSIIKALNDYKDIRSFTRKCIVNTASAGKFSSDRTIRQYADEIWHIKELPHHDGIRLW